MMDLMTKEELKELIEESGGACVSIYLPTHLKGRETEEGSLRLKNLLKSAEEELIKKGMRASEAKALLEPAKPLLSDGLFWQHQSEGLAVFLSKIKGCRYRLPLGFDELVVTGERFHTKPLLPLFATDGRFFILALSQNEVRLIQCSLYGADEVDLTGVPLSLKEAMRFDDPESQLEFHIASNTPGKGGHLSSAIFHGHGVGTDDAKDNLLRYFQELDKGLNQRLKNEKGPLILAGVGYLLSIYREVSDYPLILTESIEGSPDRLSADSLHGRAIPIIEPLFEKDLAEAVKKYEELVGTGQTSNDLEEIVIVAHEGRIGTLFVATDFQRWGAFDPDVRKVRLDGESEIKNQDLLDLAALKTLSSGGVVYAKKADELPGGAPVSAILRY